MNIGKILDSDGVEVKAGCKIWFTYGIPPVLVIAPVIERDGKLIAITDGHSPRECEVRHLEEHVASFYIHRNKK